jgi:hypothetical protein
MNSKTWGILILVLFTISCEKDERSPGELILGKWFDIKGGTVNYSFNPLKQTWDVTSNMKWSYFPGEYVIEFLDNGTVCEYNPADSVLTVRAWTWEIEEKLLIFTSSAGNPALKGEFIVDEKKLITTMVFEGYGTTGIRGKSITEEYYSRYK